MEEGRKRRIILNTKGEMRRDVERRRENPDREKVKTQKRNKG